MAEEPGYWTSSAMPTPATDVGSSEESAYAWTRLFAALLLSAIGGIGMWSVIVVLPAIQAEFGVARSAASLPYTVTMISFGFGGILMGRLSDRFGICAPVVGGAISLGVGYLIASHTTSLWQFVLAQGVLVGVAGSASFAPLIADTSLWFTRHRGLAVSIISSGSYLAGTVWPPVVQHFIQSVGWRRTYLGIAIFCVATMLPLTLALRRRSPLLAPVTSWAPRASSPPSRPLGMSPAALQTGWRRAGSATASGAGAPSCWARACRRWPSSSSCPSTVSRPSTSCPPCSACRRVGSPRPTRSSSGSSIRPRRRGCGSGPC